MLPKFHIIVEPGDIRLAILWTLHTYNKIITEELLLSTILDNTSIIYFELKENLERLIELKMVHTFKDGNEYYYEITPEGKRAVTSLGEKLPPSVRDNIKGAAKMFEKKQKTELKTNVVCVPLNESEYSVLLTIHDNNIPLINLELYAGSSVNASKMASVLRKNAITFYTELFDKIATEIDRKPGIDDIIPPSN